ncbi:AMP-binding protein [Desertibaculum subflavum]|uniref:AMP-binding protein n=1 Tax=Desertibaculum subflavum TaxID=2268458 RepID=UPI000E672F02
MQEGLGAWLDGHARSRGDAPAVIAGGDTMNFARLAAESRRVAGGLARLGIGRGDRVAFWLPNVPAYLTLFFACARLGAIAAAVNTRFKAHEVGDIVGRSGAKALVLWPAFLDIPFLDILAEVPRGALDRLETLILYSEPGDKPKVLPPIGRARTVAYADLLRGAELAGDGRRGDGVAMFTTSGTTKAPKFVLHAQSSVIDHAADVAPGFTLDRPGAQVLQMLPLCGVFGFTGTMAALQAGAPIHTLPVFDVERAGRILKEFRIGQANATDDMIRRLLDWSNETVPFPDLRFMGFAAFNHTPAEMIAMADKRGLALVGLYGMSEVQALFSRQSETAPPAERAKGGGTPVSPKAGVRVRDPESGRLLPAGEAGELEFKAPSLLKEYFGNPEATREAFTDDGWFRSGDLGQLEGDGRFQYLTRMGDVMRLGGFLVAPAEVEDFLQRHPAVEVAQVVAVPTADGNRAVGFVTLKPGCAIDEATLLAHAKSGIAGYKVPKRIVALAEMPTTSGPNGVKIQRARLRQMAVELVG